jgi:hypothetical protein
MRHAKRMRTVGRGAPAGMNKGGDTLTPASKGSSFVHSATSILNILNSSFSRVRRFAIPPCLF